MATLLEQVLGSSATAAARALAWNAGPQVDVDPGVR
jgi:hypothetical protein